MTQFLRSERARPNHPTDRGEYGRAQRCSAAPEERFNAQIQGVLAVWRRSLRGALPLTAARTVSTVHSKTGWGHLTPIGSAPGATV
jgi:hypothetical protein